ncbi:hypothetical protein AC578_1125 [Pseudocercospora eumusae]|uniref:UDENN domain-containing protein n=1 Tax=Pseudocercospora eumusae TaxID=321146 RepID=A0A139HJV5_9PEZI|nr:hypothetical protein AC578_1125 [Pseudocercospora eumusae]
MAPARPSKNNASPSSNGDTSAPLADYFFICGIESSQVYDERASVAPPVEPVETTIDEDRELEIDTASSTRPTTPASPNDALHQRRSRYSWEARKSVGSVINITEEKLPESNRSSTTIRAEPLGGLPLDDDAFEEALKKFASERDSFLADIHVETGTVTSQTQTQVKRARPKTVRITQDENSLGLNGGGLKSGVGSLRRRLSTMNSMKRSSSVMSRNSARQSKRLSGYNSVIPAPQPFQTTPNMHPLQRRYEPVLMDRYPTKTMFDESKRRTAFPDYVPMFVFPDDVMVVSSDERPRSTWHGFTMTNQDNSRLHGICVIMWVPLNNSASEALETQCEEWRKANMNQEERELAASLGERLSGERAKLSRLLADLPGLMQGSDERERLEEEISAVEEKIGLMTDLLRPVRHGAASKIDGLTEGDTGFWIPRAYGILGRDGGLTSFWKEWLKAVVVPMTNGAILRVPPSSPKVGLWQPLERYVCNLCIEALSPITSITQVEVSIRDLRLYARKEAINELPGSRNTDLYALFRCLSIPNIITLFEYALAESRIILVSSHTAMLQLASAALTSLLYPLKWAGVLIPVLPYRLIQALEAPCPYIAGIERKYRSYDLPTDDFCIVDLDTDSIESTEPPTMLPRPQRRKLQALLQAAAPHHIRYGVPVGPPPYAIEAFPYDGFSSENAQVFDARAAPATLPQYVGESSTTFGGASGLSATAKTTVFNAFLQQRPDSGRGSDRPSTSSTGTGANSNSSGGSPPSPITAPSPVSANFPTTPASRNDSGFALQASLREKRSGHFKDGLARRNSTVQSLFYLRHPLHDKTNAAEQLAMDRMNNLRRPSAPMVTGHHPSMSTSTLGAPSNYAPSVYAQSTLAASTIMQVTTIQPVRDNETTKWAEGHCLHRQRPDNKTFCTICDERCDDELFKCDGCGISVHGRCAPAVCIVCPVAFRADQVRAAFVRCFASLFYTYRKYMHPASGERKKQGLFYHFNMDQFLRSVPHGDSEYMNMLRQTQAFNEFIHERESTRSSDPSIQLFDEIILSKRNRGHRSLFSRSDTSFLSDTSDHLWRSAAATPPTSRTPGDSRTVTGRTPGKLDPTLMKEPRSIQGAPRIQNARTKRKPVSSMLGLNPQSADP